jgi:glycosyltransferase involved in cell wall biosynthesis
MSAPLAKPHGSATRTLAVAHVIASIDDPVAGPSASVPALVASLRAQNIDARLHTVAGWRGAPSASRADTAPVCRHPLNSSPLGGLLAASNALRRTLAVEARRVDVLHSHGLWLAPNFYPAAAVRQRHARARLVLSPRGMLGKEALAFSRWRKRAVWMLAQHSAARAAFCVHATAESEFDEVRAAGLRQPVAIVPNGIDIPPLAASPSRTGDRRTMLSLGRLHQKKGLDRLIKAWALIEEVHPTWRLKIVGPSENGCEAELRKLTSDLNLTHVTIEGPALGDDRAKAYRDADVFVLPSLNENFAMTLAEALAHGLPAISTHGAPWRGLAREGCGWWIPHGVESLAETMKAAMALDDRERAIMGARGRAWMARDFSWEGVGRDMAALYSWIISGGARPDCVRLD